MNSKQKWWITCTIAGIITLATSFYFGSIDGLNAIESDNQVGAIILFEIVRTPADVAALFTPQAIEAGLLDGMIHATWVDAIIFIPAYTLFLCAALMALRERGKAIAITGMVAAILAAIADQFEGIQLFAIMDALPGSQSAIDLLIPAVRVKFALLGIVSLIIGFLLFRAGKIMKVFGTIVALGGVVMLYGISADSNAAYLGLGGAISWFMLFIIAAIATIAVLYRRRQERG